MIADRFLGYRRAVLVGGVLMAIGLFAMSVQGYVTFVGGLVLLIVGNGFFKPNISVMVGNLYKPGDPKRDAGFNIFYMGINIGALIATLLAASVRNELGWLWTFRVAGFGICISTVLLLMNWGVLEAADRRPERSPDDIGFGAIMGKILAPAFGVGLVAYFMASAWLPPDMGLRPAVAGFLAGMIPVIVFFVRLGLGANEAEKPGLLALLPIYVAGATFFMILHLNGSAMTQWARDDTDRQAAMVPAAFQQEALPRYYGNAGPDVPRPHPDTLLAVPNTTFARMYGQQRMDEKAAAAVAALEGISMVELPHDADGLSEEQKVWNKRSSNVYANGVATVTETTDHGRKVITVEVPDGAKPIKRVAFVRDSAGAKLAVFLVDKDTHDGIYRSYRDSYGKDPTYLERGRFLPVVNAEVYQSFNPLFVIIFTPLVVWFFVMMSRRGRPITTARKVFYGLVLTTFSLLLMAFAGWLSDNGTMKVSGLWLGGFYAIVTIGELCLSPMGLSLVTKLSPKRLVGLTMGGWFLFVAFGNNFSGFFGGIQGRMSPMSFFLVLAGLAALTSLFIYLLLPKLETAIKKYGA
jgi:dipeptide/tripeptide permease